MRSILTLVTVAALTALSSPVFAQDPVKVHPDMYKVAFENAQVRVLRVTVPAHQKTEIHETLGVVVVPLTDYDILHTDAAGKTTESPRKAGNPTWLDAGSRSIEAGDKPVEAVLVEIKGTGSVASPK